VAVAYDRRMPRPEIKSMSNRELLEEIAEQLRHLRGLLADFEPLLAAFKAAQANGGTYTAAAGLRRTLRKARNGTAADSTGHAPRPAP
jgi:hypothetical protein